MNDMKIKLSTLWVFVLFNMVFADIVGFMNPGALEAIIKGEVEIHITQELLLIFSVMLEIPIAMILLSRILEYRTNRLANIIAAIITTLFVIGGGDTYLSYLFFASIEVVTLLFIIWFAWKWREKET